MRSRLLLASGFSLVVCFSVLIGVSGCGGNGGESGATPVVVPPPALHVSGAVADGMAWRNARVLLRCLNGAAEVAAGEDGQYEANLVGASLPCAVRVSLADGAKLYALKFGTEKDAVLNVTPLTDFLVTRLARRDAGHFFDRFDPAQTSFTSAQIKDATDEIKTLLGEFVDLRILNDFVADKLRPSTVSVSSDDPYNRLLQLLKDRLDAQSRNAVLEFLTSTSPLSVVVPFPVSLITWTSRVPLMGGWSFQFSDVIAYSSRLQLKSPPVRWSVVEADGGQIDAVTGLYVAPNKRGVFHVKAQSELKPTLSVLIEVLVQNFGTLPFFVNGALNLPAQNLVVRDMDAWKAAQEKFKLQLIWTPPEQIDFNRRMLLIVYHGGGGNGCAGITIHGWQQSGSSQTLEYDLKGVTAPDVLCTAALTYPIKVVMVDKNDLPVNFVERK